VNIQNQLEYYATPAAFTRYLLREMASRGRPIVGSLFEPCVGDGALVAVEREWDRERGARFEGAGWTTNDLDPGWAATSHRDATERDAWWQCDWTISNPPFTPAIEIIEHALDYSRVGVAMHLRASIHEVLKTGKRRTWMREHRPTGCLWLPRFAYQRSPTTDKWTTDSVCACWLIWLKDQRVPQFFDYAPEWVLDELDAETPAYRARMDGIMAARRVA